MHTTKRDSCRERQSERDGGNPSAASPRLCAFQGRAKCTLDLVFNPSQSRATNELNEQQRQRERGREGVRDRKRHRRADGQGHELIWDFCKGFKWQPGSQATQSDMLALCDSLVN